MSDTATLGTIHRHAGVAGQVAYTVTVTRDGEEPETVSFVGSSTYGGPVVMVSPAGHQLFVTKPSRFGEFGPEWVRRFFA